MITRDTILDLAQQARSEHNHKLCDLLLTVAGMLEIDGRATGIPDLSDTWYEVYGCQGAFGRGLARLVDREGPPIFTGDDVSPDLSLCPNCAGVGPCVFPNANQAERDAMGCLKEAS